MQQTHLLTNAYMLVQLKQFNNKDYKHGIEQNNFKNQYLWTVKK